MESFVWDVGGKVGFWKRWNFIGRLKKGCFGKWGCELWRDLRYYFLNENLGKDFLM